MKRSAILSSFHQEVDKYINELLERLINTYTYLTGHPLLTEGEYLTSEELADLKISFLTGLSYHLLALPKLPLQHKNIWVNSKEDKKLIDSIKKKIEKKIKTLERVRE